MATGAKIPSTTLPKNKSDFIVRMTVVSLRAGGAGEPFELLVDLRSVGSIRDKSFSANVFGTTADLLVGSEWYALKVEPVEDFVSLWRCARSYFVSLSSPGDALSERRSGDGGPQRLCVGAMTGHAFPRGIE